MIKFLVGSTIVVTIYVVVIYGFFTELKPKIDNGAKVYAEMVIDVFNLK